MDTDTRTNLHSGAYFLCPPKVLSPSHLCHAKSTLWIFIGGHWFPNLLGNKNFDHSRCALFISGEYRNRPALALDRHISTSRFWRTLEDREMPIISIYFLLLLLPPPRGGRRNTMVHLHQHNQMPSYASAATKHVSPVSVSTAKAGAPTLQQFEFTPEGTLFHCQPTRG